MPSPDRNTALSLFAYSIPGYRPTAIYDQEWNERPVPPSVPLVLAGRELFAAPLPWARFRSPDVNVVEVDNVDTWTSAAVWSAGDGSAINTDPPTWTNSVHQFVQIASQLLVDRVNVVEGSDYDIFDAALRALAEMMYVKVLKTLLGTAVLPNAPVTFRAVANAQGKLCNAATQPLSMDLMMQLGQSLNKNEGRPEQFSFVLSKSAYAQFIQGMTSSGAVQLLHDEVTGRRQWFFDDIRVVQSAYVEDGNALLYKADMSALPGEMQEGLPPSVGRGVLIGTAHPGVVISNRRDMEADDQSQATAQFTAGLVYPTGAIAWMENLHN